MGKATGNASSSTSSSDNHNDLLLRLFVRLVRHFLRFVGFACSIIELDGLAELSELAELGIR